MLPEHGNNPQPSSFNQHFITLLSTTGMDLLGGVGGANPSWSGGVQGDVVFF